MSSSNAHVAFLRYVRPRVDASTRFALAHYAGEVTYDVTSFARKNTETLTPDAHELLDASTNPWLLRHVHAPHGLTRPR